MSEHDFNEANYLMANPDVQVAVNKGVFPNGYAHYLEFGMQEKRPLNMTAKTTRESKVMASLDMNGLGLEIGPSHNPVAPKREGYQVQILDHLDQEGLQNKYAGHTGYGVNIENIEEVDFVWKGEPLTELTGMVGQYDWIIASHVIEHLPDLITFFQECEALLKPNGRLSLVVPDKRYCFDYFNAVTCTGEFLDAFYLKRKKPSPGQVFNHFANSCKLDGNIAWDSSTLGDFSLIHTIDQAVDLWKKAQHSEDYIDVHCWRFIPESFRVLIADLRELGLSSFNIIQEFDTEGCEFYVTLAKEMEEPDVIDRVNALDIVKNTSR